MKKLLENIKIKIDELVYKIRELPLKIKAYFRDLHYMVGLFRDHCMTQGYLWRSLSVVPGKSSLFPQERGLFWIVSFGRHVRPISKRPGFPRYNPWKNPKDVWFVSRSTIPYPGLFISWCTRGGRGFYVGYKPYTVDMKEVAVWALPEDVGNRYFAFSASIRRTVQR